VQQVILVCMDFNALLPCFIERFVSRSNNVGEILIGMYVREILIVYRRYKGGCLIEIERFRFLLNFYIY